MTVIHNADGGELKSSGKGDWGICTKCGKRVDHLLWSNKFGVYFSPEVTIL